jgi:hypothetical protein
MKAIILALALGAALLPTAARADDYYDNWQRQNDEWNQQRDQDRLEDQQRDLDNRIRQLEIDEYDRNEPAWSTYHERCVICG